MRQMALCGCSKKLLDVQQNAFAKRYKLPSADYYIMLLTTSNLRRTNMMKELQPIIGESDYFLFGVIPQFAKFNRRSSPTDELFKVQWERLGHPPIVLSQLGKEA